MRRSFLRSVKSQIRKRLPHWVILIREHRRILGELPRIIWPVTFSERVLRRNLFDRRPLLSRVADKIAVRSYVEERLGARLLPQLFHVTTRPETIPFDELPARFVVKPNHGSGWYQVVTDKASLDRAALIDACSEWLGRSYYEETGEIVYKSIQPKILVEQFIDDGSGAPANDYKLFVFGGRVEFIYVVTDRLSDHKRRLYTPAWVRLDVQIESEAAEGDVPPPPHLAEMVAIAECLGREWDFVRVDLYDTPNQPYFGELTLTPGGGRYRFYPREYDRYLGTLWKQAAARRRRGTGAASDVATAASPVAATGRE